MCGNPLIADIVSVVLFSILPGIATACGFVADWKLSGIADQIEDKALAKRLKRIAWMLMPAWFVTGVIFGIFTMFIVRAIIDGHIFNSLG